MTLHSQFRFQAVWKGNDPRERPSPVILALVDQLNAFAERLQNGSLGVWGWKVDFQRTAAPTDAPAVGTPNLVGVTVGGVQKLYVYDGTAWVVVGTQA